VTHNLLTTCTNYAPLDSARFMCREHMARLSDATRVALREAFAAGPAVFVPVAQAAAVEAGVAIGEACATVDNRTVIG
jgi:hypothetical protein